MKYLDKSFSISSGGSKAYRDGWDKVFGKEKCACSCHDPASPGHLAPLVTEPCCSSPKTFSIGGC
jgi:hypothetical protein